MIFCVYNYIYSDLSKFDNLPPLIEFFVFILIITYYFYEKMNLVSKNPIYNSISFWICVGLFIYFTGNFFFYLLVTSSKDIVLLKKMKIIYALVSISKDLILAFAWFAHERIETDADIIKVPDGLGLDDDLPFLKQTNS